MITNYLSPLEFQVSVKRLPEVEFFTQKLEIPSLSAPGITMNNPFNYTHLTPSKADFSSLNLSFVVDENMKNYRSVFDWMMGVSFTHDFDKFKNTKNSSDGLTSDISVIILNSNKNANMIINFIDCFPIALSPINLDTTQNSVYYPNVTATFTYTYFTIDQYK